MRNYLVASTVGHVVFLVGTALLSLLVGEEAPAFETVSVNLTALELPAPQETPPAPEPEPEPIPEAPPEAEVKAPELEPEPPAEIPEPVIEQELVPPTPELPPEPKPVIEDPTPPVEEFDLPEPDAVEPAPVETTDPQLEDPVAPEIEALSLDANTTLQSKSTEGMPDYYYAVIKAKISRRWDPTRSSTRGSRESMAVISFKISASGAILDADITESSRLSVFDRQCLRAVLNASPLPAPPRSYLKAGSLPIAFVFTYQ